MQKWQVIRSNNAKWRACELLLLFCCSRALFVLQMVNVAVKGRARDAAFGAHSRGEVASDAQSRVPRALPSGHLRLAYNSPRARHVGGDSVALLVWMLRWAARKNAHCGRASCLFLAVCAHERCKQEWYAVVRFLNVQCIAWKRQSVFITTPKKATTHRESQNGRNCDNELVRCGS